VHLAIAEARNAHLGTEVQRNGTCMLCLRFKTKTNGLIIITLVIFPNTFTHAITCHDSCHAHAFVRSSGFAVIPRNLSIEGRAQVAGTVLPRRSIECKYILIICHKWWWIARCRKSSLACRQASSVHECRLPQSLASSRCTTFQYNKYLITFQIVHVMVWKPHTLDL
jgi:hypothetical protein